MNNKSFLRLLLLVFCIAFTFGSARAQTSAFTYQGKLSDMSVPANGQYDFTFRLLDAASGGNQIGTDAVFDNVQVTNGIFTVNLNFGAQAFTGGGQRFLEISVRPGAETGAYTTLAPRQQITSSPFSVKAISATSADALSSLCDLCVTNGQIQSIDGSKITGAVANATTAAVAGNVTGIVQIANGGTGSSTKNFVDLSTDQTVGGNKTFTGILNGNGSGLTNIPGALRWQTISGSAQQAQPNNGYLANSSEPVTITLPTAPNVGDVVRIAAVGAGGWKIAQNVGQSIIVTQIKFFNENWTPRGPNSDWRDIAMSADGTKLTAISGRIYTSSDSGLSWTARESETERLWKAVAMSADGSKQVAVGSGLQIYVSIDSGETWLPRETERLWIDVAMSADGSKIVATVANGQIYTSADSGNTWTPRDTDRNWASVASSADGIKLVATTSNGPPYYSTDAGENWTYGNGGGYFIASSADGNKLIAANNNGVITSNNAGATWIGRIIPERYFTSVASSADGNILVVGAENGIYVSRDSGVTWTRRERIQTPAVAVSADGNKFAAATFQGRIYTSAPTTTVGTTGFLTGGQHTSIELQYIGGGQFLPVSFVGEISGF